MVLTVEKLLLIAGLRLDDTLEDSTSYLKILFSIGQVLILNKLGDQKQIIQHPNTHSYFAIHWKSEPSRQVHYFSHFFCCLLTHSAPPSYLMSLVWLLRKFWVCWNHNLFDALIMWEKQAVFLLHDSSSDLDSFLGFQHNSQELTLSIIRLFAIWLF